MNTAIDIPVFVHQETLKEIAIGRLKKEMAAHGLSTKEAQALEQDIADLKRLNANGVLTNCEFQICWRRAYRKYRSMVVVFGHYLRTGEKHGR